MPAYLELQPQPSIEVTIDGQPLPTSAMLQLGAVSIEEDIGLPSMFTLEMAGGHMEDETSWIDGNLFTVGAAVDIALGYGDKLQTLIAGEITSLEPLFMRSGRPSLTVRGYDPRHRLLRGRKTRSFTQRKDSDIVTALASEAGLTVQAEDSSIVHDYVLQANQTDLEFLEARARRIQYELVVSEQTLRFRPVQNQRGESLTLTLEDDLLEFAPRLSTMGQFSALELRGWSPKDRKEIVAKAGDGDAVSSMGGNDNGAALVKGAFGDATLLIGDQPVLNQAEADQLARACLNRTLLRLVHGEGICRGRTDLHPGQVIRIEGIGKRFTGQYYVSGTSHRYFPDQPYRTHFTVTRNAV